MPAEQAGTLPAGSEPTAAVPPVSEGDSTAAATVYNPDWTEATHGKVSPNYAVVTTDALFNRSHALITPHVVGANGERPGATYLVSPRAFTGALGELKTHVQARRTLIAGFFP